MHLSMNFYFFISQGAYEEKASQRLFNCYTRPASDPSSDWAAKKKASAGLQAVSQKVCSPPAPSRARHSASRWVSATRQANGTRYSSTRVSSAPHFKKRLSEVSKEVSMFTPPAVRNSAVSQTLILLSCLRTCMRLTLFGTDSQMSETQETIGAWTAVPFLC